MHCHRLEELAAPYFIWKKKGFSVTVASIKGGEIPLDPASLQEENLGEHSKNFLSNGMGQLSNVASFFSVAFVQLYNHPCSVLRNPRKFTCQE